MGSYNPKMERVANTLGPVLLWVFVIGFIIMIAKCVPDPPPDKKGDYQIGQVVHMTLGGADVMITDAVCNSKSCWYRGRLANGLRQNFEDYELRN